MKALTRFFSTTALGVLGCSIGLCGTFSIQGVQFVSTTTTDATIQAQGNDVKYTMSKTLQTSGSQSLTAWPLVQGNFHWVVRWTGGPGETHPSTVTCKIAAYGHGYANSHIYTNNPYPGSYKATTDVQDQFVNPYAAVAGSVVYFHLWATDGSQTDAHQGYTFAGAGQSWTNISGNIWESTADFTVGSQTTLEAEFLPQVPMQGFSLAQVDLAITLRVIEVSGQSVAPDF